MPLETTPLTLPSIWPNRKIKRFSSPMPLTGDAAFIRHTLNTVARARGMTQIARDAGVTREALYRALGPEGDPRMSTLLGVFEALGVKLSALRQQSVDTGSAQTITAKQKRGSSSSA